REWERVGVSSAGVEDEGGEGEGIELEHEHEHEHENDRISDERTQKQGRSHSGESDRRTRKEVGTGKGARSTASSGKGSHGKKKRKKRKEERDEDAANLRSAAKGRVAEWLGRLQVPAADEEHTGQSLDLADAEADVEAFRRTGAVSPGGRSPMLSPLEGRSEAGKMSPAASPRVSKASVDGLPAVPPLPDFLTKRSPSREVLNAKAAPSTSPSARKAESVELARDPEPKPDTKEVDASAKPNPRSSGFVPISTLREHPQPRTSRFISRPDASLPNTSHNPTSPRARYEAALKSSSPPPPPPAGAKQPVKKADQKRWPAFPPQPQGDAPAKYDVRSARGGRGGKVTAVTAIWATAAAGTNKAAPAKPKPSAKPIVAPKPKAPTRPVVANKPTVPPSKPIPVTKRTPVSFSKPTPAATPKPAHAKTPTLAAHKPPPPGKPRTLLDLPKTKPSMGMASGPQRTSPHASPALGPAKGASVPAVVSSSLATPHDLVHGIPLAANRPREKAAFPASASCYSGSPASPDGDHCDGTCRVAYVEGGRGGSRVWAGEAAGFDQEVSGADRVSRSGNCSVASFRNGKAV
ncbi:hypothetical protein EVG20_g9398, partial [Dentipellis fragilis]